MFIKQFSEEVLPKMEYRPLEITLISAEGIKNVNKFTTMDVYAVISIGGDPRTKQRSFVNKNAGTNPKWNLQIKFTVDEISVTQCSLQFELKSDRALGDKDIGDVSIPIRELLDYSSNTEMDEGIAKPERVVVYPVRRPSGKQKGTLKFSYKFGKKIIEVVPETRTQKVVQPSNNYPMTAYPPPGSAGAYPPPGSAGSGPSYLPTGYPIHQPRLMAPQQNYPTGGGYPPSGYGGYPTQAFGGGGYPQANYGYPAPPQHGYMVQPQEHKKKSGSKLGLGFGAGLLGGLLVGDMIGDMAEMGAYEYDDSLGDL